MAKFDYSKMKDLASRLLDDFGGSTKITITYSSANTFDVATQTNTVTESTFDVWGVVVPFNQGELKISQRESESVLSTDLKMFVEVTSRAPEVGDSALYKSKTYRIMNVETKSPGGVDLMYVCQLRI